MKTRMLTLLAFALCCALASAQDTISLAGQWQFEIDRTGAGQQESWYGRTLKDVITLPGSMPEQGKGDPITMDTKWTGSLYDSSYYFNPHMQKYRVEGNVKLPFFLTPDRHYVGRAWYQRDVEVPADWQGREVWLHLERPHTVTTVWVNGKRIGSQNSLCVAHDYNLTAYVVPGQRNRVSIEVDNSFDIVGQDSHSISDQTQGNWNGIVGALQLTALPAVSINSVSVYPSLSKGEAKVVMQIRSTAARKVKLRLGAEAFNTQATHRTKTLSHTVALAEGDNTVELTLPMGKYLTWDEFSPALYRLTAEAGGHSVETEFGMREIVAKGKDIYVNGRLTFLRGTVENCDFPLTGYAPMDEASWERVFRICREWGLNHMRFHSYCPPEAAFRAADRVGFYLQPECPAWVNHGAKLGNGDPIDQYLWDEAERITQAYGNHASFTMLASGNEPAGRWVAWCSKFVDYWRAKDTRRIYTGASVGGSWAWQPRNQYHVKAGARGLDWLRSAPESMSDYRNNIDTVSQPFVSHETGQWCAFPNFQETEKYTGHLRARNFEIFEDLLREHGMDGLGRDFMLASGRLQALCYKHEIERHLRTPHYAGFQLLGLNDYSGQGTALVGVLDVFWDEKGYISAPEWRRFCAPTVPLARMPKFVYTNAETLSADVEVAHYGPAPLPSATVRYAVRNTHGRTLFEGTLGEHDIPLGNCTALGSISLPLADFTLAEKLTLEVSIDGTEASNAWDFWVYPAAVSTPEGDILVKEELDDEALRTLRAGGSVLLTAAGRIKYGQDVKQYFTPVFWNTSWFKMRPPHTTGLLVDSDHPIFADFPTEASSDLQWWELANRAQAMQLTQFPDEFQPIVHTIDTWFLSRKLGMLFEARVGGGRLVMTTFDITSRLSERPVARQLRHSILQYMHSADFQPTQEIEPALIRALYTDEAEKVNFFTNDSPDELKKGVR